MPAYPASNGMNPTRSDKNSQTKYPISTKCCILIIIDMEKEKTIINWEAPEFSYIEKEPIWFLSVGLFGAIFLIYSIWQQNLLFAIFIIISSLLLFHWAKEKPKTLLFTLSEDGINIGENHSYLWSNLEYFCILKSHREHDHFGELIIRRKDRINPYLTIHIPANQLVEIREYCLLYLKESEYTETYTDAIQRLIKF